MQPIYFDYAASTPIDGRVLEAMLPWLGSEGMANPHAQHAIAAPAKNAIEAARQQVADLINAKAPEIIFTSGATESINMALQGVARFYRSKGTHIITSAIEHKATSETLEYLQTEGYTVTVLPVDRQGLISVADLKDTIQDNTILVTLHHINNEIGTIQPIAELGAICRQHKVLFHVDAAQSLAKQPIDVEACYIDYLSLSAHKGYGPKGIGALYVRMLPRARIKPLCYGGGQERHMRPGTLATHQIVGMGAACELATAQYDQDIAHITACRQPLVAGLTAVGGVHINGSETQSVPHIISVSFDDIQAAALKGVLGPLAVSKGSACTLSNALPSHVLTAIGLSQDTCATTLRFSLGRTTTIEEIDRAIAWLSEHLPLARKMIPLWETKE